VKAGEVVVAQITMVGDVAVRRAKIPTELDNFQECEEQFMRSKTFDTGYPSSESSISIRSDSGRR